MSFDRIIIITRKTRLQEAVRRFNTKSQARFYVQSRGQSFEDYEKEDDTYQIARESIFRSCPRDVKVAEIDRTFLPNYVFGPNDLVLVVGQDGLVVNTGKYLDGQCILAVNPDPDRFDGVLLPFQVPGLEQVIGRCFAGAFKTRAISMASAELGDGQRLFALNDFFIGIRNHYSARYTLHYQGMTERQISSGVIVSTPAGSTGWMSSLYNMAKGLSSFCGIAADLALKPMSWEERRLLFAVREPFRSKWSGSDLVAGAVAEGEVLRLESHMAEGGIVFSDGMDSDFIEFNSGSTLSVSLAKKTTNLIVNA